MTLVPIHKDPNFKGSPVSNPLDLDRQHQILGDPTTPIIVTHGVMPPVPYSELPPLLRPHMQTINDQDTFHTEATPDLGPTAVSGGSMLHPNFGVMFLANALVNDRDLPHTNFEEIRQMMNELVDLGIKKDSEYGASWCKRLGPGAFFTIWRKIDRLENQAEKMKYDLFNVEGDPTSTESLDETLLDAIFYFALLLQKRRTKQRMIAEATLAHTKGIDK